jgi:DNA modification methylase
VSVGYEGWTEIEVTTKDEVGNLSSKMMELSENIARKDISWQEKIEAIRQLDELKRKEHGSAAGGGPGKPKQDGWSVEKTADFIGKSSGTVSEDIKLAKNLIEHPELRKKCNKLNKQSAKKYVNQKIEAQELEKRMKDKGIVAGIRFINGSCEAQILNLDSRSIHCLITDPPFALDNISAIGKGDSDVGLHYNVSGTNVGSEGNLARVYDILIPQIHRVLVEGAHFYIFLGMGWYTRLVTMLRTNGLIVDDQPIIWHKQRTSLPARGAHYTSSYEACLFGHKPPQKRILLKPTPNMLSIPAINPSSRVHPLQKPFDLIKLFIKNSTSTGETILDCFAGSAETLVAAKKLHRNSIGFEIDRDNYLRAQEYINNEFNAI